MIFVVTRSRALCPALLAALVGVAAAGCGKDDEGGADGTMTTGVDTEDSTFGSSGVDETGPIDPTQPMGECFLWQDQCGEGRKCMPWSAIEDRVPDETRCCDEVDNPDLVGEECEIMMYDGSCLDSCALGSICVLDRDDTLTGLCREVCNPAVPDCGADATCKSFFEALETTPNVPLCMDRCDPLLQDCSPPTWGCIPDSPTEAGQSGFICVPPTPGAPKDVFDACGLANDCDQGLVCITDSRVPGCEFTSCCTAFCSLSEGDDPCRELHPDMECVDWMATDPVWADVGACAVPS